VCSSSGTSSVGRSSPGSERRPERSSSRRSPAATTRTSSTAAASSPARSCRFRIEYVVDKTSAGKALLGHPFVLRAVEQLQGPSFVPTWDSMVFKRAGAGAAIGWHRDAGTDHNLGSAPIFNVDVYLDPSDGTNCLWAVPGSHRWSEEEAGRAVDELGREGFGTAGAVPLPLRPGDVLLHDILVVHGSPPARSALRRVVNLEFRPAEVELAVGPHLPVYVGLKQRVLLAALAERRQAAYARDERPFRYRGRLEPVAEATEIGWRYPHERYWRDAA
jgi:phytanoyl-CoA hydroxylase